MSVLVNAEYSPGSGPWWGIALGGGTGEGASPLPAGGGIANPDTRWKAVSAIQCWLVLTSLRTRVSNDTGGFGGGILVPTFRSKTIPSWNNERVDRFAVWCGCVGVIASRTRRARRTVFPPPSPFALFANFRVRPRQLALVL